MSEQSKRHGESRRRQILRGIVTGSGIAGGLATTRWTEPVVRAVTLPAHAATSAASTRNLARFSLTVDVGSLEVSMPGGEWFARRGDTASPLDFLIPPARAMNTSSRRMVLVEQPGQRYDFSLLETRYSFEGCNDEWLIVARDIPLFTPVPTDMETCLGGLVDGPEVEVIDVVDDEVTIRLDFSEIHTLVRDPEAQPMTTVTPCPCLGN